VRAGPDGIRFLSRDRLLHKRLAAVPSLRLLTGVVGGGIRPAHPGVAPARSSVLMASVPTWGSAWSSRTASSLRWANRARSCSDSSPAIPTSTRHNRPTRAEHDRLGGKIGREGDLGAVMLPLPPLFS
jgi:hypothetical protein